jgi:hypothetical protein
MLTSSRPVIAAQQASPSEAWRGYRFSIWLLGGTYRVEEHLILPLSHEVDTPPPTSASPLPISMTQVVFRLAAHNRDLSTPAASRSKVIRACYLHQNHRCICAVASEEVTNLTLPCHIKLLGASSRNPSSYTPPQDLSIPLHLSLSSPPSYSTSLELHRMPSMEVTPRSKRWSGRIASSSISTGRSIA